MSMPLVSICLPNLNSRPFLEQRMESLLTQTLTDWELIIVDNYSDDGAWDFFQKFKGDKRIRLVQAPRRGMYANWNNCFRLARGEYVHVATSDDSCSPTFLDRLVSHLERLRDCDLAVSQFDYTDESGNVIDPPPHRRKLDSVYRDCLNRDVLRPREAELLIHFCLGGIPWITASALVFRRSLLARTGLFLENAGPHADMIWSLKCSLFSDTISVPEHLATWLQRHDQASSKPFMAWNSMYIKLLVDVLAEHVLDLPAGWIMRDGWQSQLLHSAQMCRLREFRLNRSDMRNHPLTFLKGMSSALYRNPGYLCERIQCGLSWASQEAESEYDHFWRVVRDWNVDWRPLNL